MRWENLCNSALCSQLCVTLLHSVWLVALLAFVAWVVDRLVGRRAVERSYAVYVAALLASMMALPATYWIVAAQGVTPTAEVAATVETGPAAASASPVTAPPATIPSGTDPVSAPPAALASVAVPRVAVAEAASPASPPGPGLWATIAPWLSASYAAGVVVMLLRLALGMWRAQRLGAGAEILRDGPLVDLLHSLADQWSMRVVPTLARAERIVTPKVIGLLRPTILLPASAISGLSTDELELILAHELAHVRRFDMWVNLIQRLAEVVLFFNPALWYLSRRISLLREYCCDEAVCGGTLAVDNAPHLLYAQALLRVVEVADAGRDRAELASLAANGRSPSQLRCRVARLFGEPVTESVRFSRRGVVAIGVLAVLLATGPIVWRSSANTPEPAAVEDNDVGSEASRSDEVVEVGSIAPATEPDLGDMSIVVAKHGLLLDGKEIITWPELEARIAALPDPAKAHPNFYITRGAREGDGYQAAKDRIWRFHRDYKLAGHSEGSLWPRCDLRYDRIEKPEDLIPDPNLRVAGTVVDQKGEPVEGAEVILITPVDESIPYKSYHMALAKGRVWNRLEHVMTDSGAQGKFTLYPPKDGKYYLAALHPKTGFALTGAGQFRKQGKIILLPWAGLVGELAEEPGTEQTASIRTVLPESDRLPEVVINQEWSSQKSEQPKGIFGFTHVPPILNTSIDRSLPDKEGVSFSLSGATVSLMPGETRTLGLGPLTEQQREWLETLRQESKKRTEGVKLEVNLADELKHETAGKTNPSADALPEAESRQLIEEITAGSNANTALIQHGTAEYSIAVQRFGPDPTSFTKDVSMRFDGEKTRWDSGSETTVLDGKQWVGYRAGQRLAQVDELTRQQLLRVHPRCRGDAFLETAAGVVRTPAFPGVELTLARDGDFIKVTSLADKGQVRHEHWIDPSRGYVIVRHRTRAWGIVDTIIESEFIRTGNGACVVSAKHETHQDAHEEKGIRLVSKTDVTLKKIDLNARPDAAAFNPSGAQGDEPSDSPAPDNQFTLRIVDPAGKPVPAALVEIRTSPAPMADQILQGEFVSKSTYGSFAKADEAGRLVVTFPQNPDRLNFSIKTPGYGPYWADCHADYRDKTVPNEFTAQLDTAWSIGGIVVDEEGKRIEGAEISPGIDYKAPGDKQHLGLGDQFKTDAQGTWSFDCVPVSMNQVWVEVDHPDYMPNRRSLTRAEFEIKPGNAPAGRIVLSRGLTVSGKVTDDAGAPVQGALVRTQFFNDVHQAETNEAGLYTLVGCEPTLARIVATAEGMALDMKEVRIEPEMSSVDFQMQPGGKVRIRVLDENDKPIPKARIFFQWWRGGQAYFPFAHVNEYADENGVWQWNDAPHDEFQADICRPGGMQITKQKLIARDEEYVLHPPRALVITGTVVDAETNEPVKTVQAIPGRQDANERIIWDRDEGHQSTDGKYRLVRTYGCHAHLVRIEADGYLSTVSRQIQDDEGNVTLNFEMKKGRDVAATLLAPDGNPAAGAEIALGVAGSQIVVENGEFSRSTFASRTTADDSGKFHFPAQGANFQVVVTHPAGYAYVKAAPDSFPATIELTAWARVQGTFRIGQQPAANVPLRIAVSENNSYGTDVPTVSFYHEVTTAPDGSFTFDRVVPGKGRIGRDLVLMATYGALEKKSSSMIATEFPAGETVQINLGGTGRAVVGKLEPPDGFTGKVPWNFALLKFDLPDPETPASLAKAPSDPDARKAWWAEWIETEEGKAWNEANERYNALRQTKPRITATVGSDGTFRIDDVPPDEYTLRVGFDRESPGRLHDHRFAVPAADGDAPEVVDLGTLKLTESDVK